MVSVLIVDDDDFVSEIVTTYLRTVSNWLVSRVSLGAEAIQELTVARPDIVLMDLRLPDMSGLELIKYIKANEAACEVPVVVMSGHDELSIKRDALKAGAIRYLTKPIFPGLLQTVIEETLA